MRTQSKMFSCTQHVFFKLSPDLTKWISASFVVEGALFCEAWDESMNTRGNEPNKIVEAIGGRQRIHKLAKQEVKSLIVIIIIVFLWGVHKGGSIVGVC